MALMAICVVDAQESAKKDPAGFLEYNACLRYCYADCTATGSSFYCKDKCKKECAKFEPPPMYANRNGDIE